MAIPGEGSKSGEKFSMWYMEGPFGDFDALLGCSKSFESGNENTFFFGEITFIAQYNLP